MLFLLLFLQEVQYFCIGHMQKRWGGGSSAIKNSQKLNNFE